MSAAKTPETPETKARARRWSRVERFAVRMTFVAIGLPPVALGVAVLLHMNGDDSAFGVVWWVVGAAAVVLVAAAFLEIHAQGHLTEAKFAAGYLSAGMVDEVIEEPSEVLAPSTLTLMITAELPGRVRIRRRLDSSMYQAGPGARVGQTMIFRHNTLDPDDLGDVVFVRFTGMVQKRRRR
ncbi:hypothetical protein [Streptomyces profundus]|uniref:hypothetical protein n=1 Tax=Streptomyces profundus TaxID=2867410 RepID=UPI001D1611B5|nr:hypothetical protein [Streptomyces sp. MA3_2.13]UED86287.1 hypothetical protein K4G22_20535 [Streptomyces sp. MA3_2.13]